MFAGMGVRFRQASLRIRTSGWPRLVKASTGVMAILSWRRIVHLSPADPNAIPRIGLGKWTQTDSGLPKRRIKRAARPITFRRGPHRRACRHYPSTCEAETTCAGSIGPDSLAGTLPRRAAQRQKTKENPLHRRRRMLKWPCQGEKSDPEARRSEWRRQIHSKRPKRGTRQIAGD